MSARGGYRSKHKKPVQTTLGRAPQNPNNEFLDLSHLRKPIDTSLFGLTQVLSLFETATNEVRRYIAHECDLMFECRICRTIFRSVANFVLHKRNYCPESYSPINDDNRSDFENNDLKIVNTDSPPSSPDGKANEIERTSKRASKRDLRVVLKKLSDKQECHEYTQSVVNEELNVKNPPRENGEKYMEKEEQCKTMYLEGIRNSKEGVFQTMSCENAGEDLMKSEVMEIHSILNTNEAILGPDGKVFTFKSDINNTSAQKLICTVCNLKFATKKTLTHHIKYKHNDTRLIYICPDCKDSFANAWCVFRHLYKVHRKTTTQIRRMRDQIHSTAIAKKQEPAKKRTSTVMEIENDVEEDSQHCDGCGKRFERKAALHSHMQMCLKRLALNAEKEFQKHIQDACKEKTATPRGSSKRKPDISQRIVRHCDLDAIPEDVGTEKHPDVVENVEINKHKADIKDKAAAVEDRAFQKHLIEEIILGSRSCSDTNSSLDKKFIGFISDEEEILGFVKGSDILINPPNNTTNEKADQQEQNDRLNPKDEVNSSAANVEEETIIHPLFPQADITSNLDPGETDIIIHIDESETIQKDPEVTFTNNLSKNTTPRQYSSKKNKTGVNLNSSASDQNTDETSPNLILINNNTTEIDLPYEVRSKDVTSSAADCNISETNETLSVCSSDSDSCSCFDERSEDSGGSSISSMGVSKTVFEENLPGNKIDTEETTEFEKNCGEDKRIIGETIEIISDMEDFDENNKDDECKTATIQSNIDYIDSSSSKSSTEELVEDLDTYLIGNKAEMVESLTQFDSVKIIENLGQNGDKGIIEETIEINSDLEDEINRKDHCETPIIVSKQNESLLNTISQNLEQSLAENKNGAIGISDIPLKENVEENLNNPSEEISHKSELSKLGDNPGHHFVSNKENNIGATNRCGKKRKLSDESTLSDGPENSLREQCENYADWATLSCQSCLNTFETTEKLLEHMALHFNWLQYECMNCNFMSYDKNTCKQHLCHANAETESADNRIASLPLWKTVSMSTPFTNIVSENDCSNDGDSEIDQEESTLTCNANEIKTQDPSLRKMIMEVIFGPQDTGTEPEMSLNSARPIRNRRSIRTVQKDFEYDMKQIDSKVKKPKNKIKPIKIVKNSDLNFQVVSVTSEENKKKRTDD